MVLNSNKYFIWDSNKRKVIKLKNWYFYLTTKFFMFFLFLKYFPTFHRYSMNTLTDIVSNKLLYQY